MQIMALPAASLLEGQSSHSQLLQMAAGAKPCKAGNPELKILQADTAQNGFPMEHAMFVPAATESGRLTLRINKSLGLRSRPG